MKPPTSTLFFALAVIRRAVLLWEMQQVTKEEVKSKNLVVEDHYRHYFRLSDIGAGNYIHSLRVSSP